MADLVINCLNSATHYCRDYPIRGYPYCKVCCYNILDDNYVSDDPEINKVKDELKICGALKNDETRCKEILSKDKCVCPKHQKKNLITLKRTFTKPQREIVSEPEEDEFPELEEFIDKFKKLKNDYKTLEQKYNELEKKYIGVKSSIVKQLKSL